MASPTKKLFSFIFLVCFATSFTALTYASPPPLPPQCLNSNFTSGSRYGANINSLLSSLSSSSSTHGFYNLTHGRSPDTAYALGLCRGDVSPQTCQSCIRNATSGLSQGCGNSKEGVIWYDECMLRYSNRSIFGSMETGPYIWAYNTNNVSNPGQFNEVVRNLLSSLREHATVSGNSFATGNMASSNLTRVYGLVQCTPDLNATSCNNCLNYIIQVLPQCCDGRQGGRVLAPSCNFRYEIGQFYAGPDSALVPTPAAEPLPAASDDGVPPPAQPSGASNAPSASTPTPASAANTIAKKSNGILAAFVTLLVF